MFIIVLDVSVACTVLTDVARNTAAYLYFVVCVSADQQGDNLMEFFWLFKMAATLPIQHF
jgi:hypothetical protein